MYMIFSCLISLCAGRKGQFTGSSGLQIAYLSGIESPTGESDAVHFNKRDVAALIAPSSSDSKFKGIDILLTSQCPLGVEKYSQSKVRLLKTVSVVTFQVS